MNTFINQPTSAHAFRAPLSPEVLKERAPAIFGSAARPTMSSRYTFIPTERVLEGLNRVGFVPVDAQQVRARTTRVPFARHLIRLQRRLETVQIKEAVPEIVMLNSHDGSSAYELRLGVYRAVCTNGLMVSAGSFPGVRVLHRKNVVDEVVTGALQLAEKFEALALQVERMQARLLYRDEQLELAEAACALRYPNEETRGLASSVLLTCQRPEDQRESLWNLLNRVQENLLTGRFMRHSPSGRLIRMRRLSSIREVVRINGALWSFAVAYLER